MQHGHYPLRKRQSDAVPSAPSASGVVGGATAVSVGVGSSLLLGSPATSVPLVTNSLNPAITITPSSSPLPSSTSSSPAASHTSSSLSTGAVLGISAAVFVVAVAVMFAVYTHYKKRTYVQARRPPPRGAPPTPRIEEGHQGRSGDKWQRLEGDKPPAEEANPPAPPKTPELGELFEKDPSVRSVSDEKANHSFDPATMPNFVKYHPDLAEGLSTAPPSRPFAAGESSQVRSWSGDSAADSFLSLRTSGSMSPSAVIRQTPMTTDSALHRWESAEVLIMHEPERPSIYSEPEVAQDPFRDEASQSFNDGNEADTRATGSNPFFNASSQVQHNPFSDRSSRSRKSSISTVKRSRSNSVASRGTVRAGAGDNALLSLIAALDSHPVPSEDPSRASVQTASSVYTQGSIIPPTPKAF